MKYNILLATMATAMMLPAVGQAQEHKTKTLPDAVTEVRLEDYATLRVVQGDEDKFAFSGQLNEKSAQSGKGTRVVLNSPESDVTLYLKPGRSMVFNTQDFSNLTLIGDFAPMDSLVLHTEDYSHIEYKGDVTDTLRARHMRLESEDYSRISSTNPVQYGVGRYNAHDYSRIDLAAYDLCSRLAPDGVTNELYTNSDFGRINSGRFTKDGVLQHERQEGGYDEALEVTDKITSGIADMARKAVRKMNRHPWETELDFAWGWHNWGDQLGAGFSGVEGASAVSTNFHNIQLAINIPVINVRGFAFKAGLGLDWDRYNFQTPEVFFDASASPMTFAAGTTGSAVATSRLKTRCIVVPLKFEFGNPKKWHISVTAMPGLNWSGNNTGLRRRYNMVDPAGSGTTRKEKDYAINQYMNPYHLDVRLAVQYKGMGLYVQAATLPLLKDGCQELYPVKFGIIL